MPSARRLYAGVGRGVRIEDQRNLAAGHDAIEIS
jgi:hypothetical protein